MDRSFSSLPPRGAPRTSWRPWLLAIGLCVLAGCAGRPGGGDATGRAPGGATGASSSSGGGGVGAGAATSRPVVPGNVAEEGRPAAPAAALVPERKYLADWFSGTPVTIAFDRDGALRVEVPLEFAFTPGQSKMKPALGKVLDRVGTSLRRVRDARVHVAAPADLVTAQAAKTDATMADKRGAAIRDAIVSRGVNLIRIASVTQHPSAAVVIRIVAGSPG